jgi:hypothetical protein
MRSKPDFLAGLVVFDGTKQLRALEVLVKSGNLYALQPRRGRARKVSYHESGQSHYKIGDSAPILPIVDLPTRFLKERAFPLSHNRRRLFAVSLENLPILLPYTGQPYDRKIELCLPKVEGLFVIELYLGSNSGQRWSDECEGYVEATITEQSFNGAGYDFCIRAVVLSSTPVYRRTIDEQISSAWREAGTDLGIRVVAPFSLVTSGGDSVLYEMFLPDFGGPKGIIAGSFARDDGNMRKMQGYYSSDLADRYRKYDRDLFIDTLNDWRWFGEEAENQPGTPESRAARIADVCEHRFLMALNDRVMNKLAIYRQQSPRATTTLPLAQSLRTRLPHFVPGRPDQIGLVSQEPV